MRVQFITEPTIGPKERRLIRSHVMKGKNAGKSRSSRTQLIPPHHNQLPDALKDNSSDMNKLMEADFKHTLPLNRLLWNDLSLTSYSLHISPATGDWVYQRLWVIAKALYPPEFCNEVDLSQYIWFQYILEDQAYFHCLLAICSSFPNHFGGPRHISPVALNHISQAYRMTNERLSGSESCSDKAIAVVTMLAIYQRMHHQQSIGLVHLNGLRRMVELRGGLARLTSENRGLAQKPWRLALEFALQDGTPVTFDIVDIPQPTFDTSCLRNFSPVTSQMSLDPALLIHFNSITSFTHLLNANAQSNWTKICPLDYSDSVCLRLHRLLDYAPLRLHHQKCLAPLDDLVYLALVTTMTTLLPEYGHNQAQYVLLSRELRGALRRYTVVENRDSEVFLWALLVGYVTLLDESDKWLVPLARELGADLGLHTWMDVQGMLIRYPWIGVLYEKAGLKLW